MKKKWERTAPCLKAWLSGKGGRNLGMKGGREVVVSIILLFLNTGSSRKRRESNCEDWKESQERTVRWRKGWTFLIKAFQSAGIRLVILEWGRGISGEERYHTRAREASISSKDGQGWQENSQKDRPVDPTWWMSNDELEERVNKTEKTDMKWRGLSSCPRPICQRTLSHKSLRWWGRNQVAHKEEIQRSNLATSRRKTVRV